MQYELGMDLINCTSEKLVLLKQLHLEQNPQFRRFCFLQLAQNCRIRPFQDQYILQIILLLPLDCYTLHILKNLRNLLI